MVLTAMTAMRTSVPARVERQDERAEERHRNVVGRDGIGGAIAVVLADARSDDLGADQSGDATGQMHHRAAGEVDVSMSEAEVLAQHRQPSAAPHPVGVDGIDDGGDDEAEEHEGDELPALGHGPGGDGGGGVHEHHLEEEHRRHRRRVVGERQKESFHAEESELMAAEVESELLRQRGVPAEGAHRADAAHLQCEAERPEAENPDGVDEKVHGHRMADVLRAGETGLHQGEARLHEHHQEPCQQSPDDIR
jgi:hypothetical protein